jgi:WD domain, G-beta repeat
MTARIWDTASGQLAHTLAGHNDSVDAVAWSPDGRQLATAGRDKSARVWDTASGQQVSILTSRGDMTSVAWSPDGRLLATGSNWDNAARIWEASSGELARTMLHDNWVKSVTWSPDGRWLAASGLHATARVWDAASGELRQILTGHQGDVESVAWSPDGRLLATGGEDGTIRLWLPLTSASPVAAITPLADGGWAVLYPDGRYKYAGTPDGEFFWVVGLHRFEPGEIDEYADAIRRVPLSTPLVEGTRDTAGKPAAAPVQLAASAQPVLAIEEKPRESLQETLPELTQFDSIALGAMRQAASMPRPGEAIDTRMILLAVARVHAHGRWDRIWLYCAHSPDDIASQQNIGDPKAAPIESPDGMKLTVTCADGLREAARIAGNHNMLIAPGVLILGALTDPASGAARALGVGTTIEHSDLMRLVAEELLGW